MNKPTEKEKMLAGELYDSTDAVLVEERSKVRKLLHKFNISEYHNNDFYRTNLTELLPNCAGDIYIEPPFYCDYGYNIYCGEKVYFNFNCVILDVVPVIIGNNVFFGPGVQLYTATHPLNYEIRKTLESGKPISIGNDCWIGGAAIICPGVTIGDRCVIGAGSVITKHVPSDSLVVGNPGKIIRNLK
ncbi:MAG: sugar O-acetyltransferase [Opitutaceae bacterium]|nr:sugar O-acetyltransferase [Cytophagales bacterium]